MYLQELQDRLIEIAKERVRAGETTERSLARVCGVSQPHLHNVLKNVRALSTDAADRLMQALDVRVADLLWGAGGDADTQVAAVPVLRNRLGPGSDASLTVFRGRVPIAGRLLKGVVEPLAARLAADLVMPGALAANDLVLLDQNPEVRKRPSGKDLWVVTEGHGLRVRYLRMGGTRLYVASEATVSDPQHWQSVALQGQDILNLVRARIVWIGREMEARRDGPGEQAGRSD